MVGDTVCDAVCTYMMINMLSLGLNTLCTQDQSHGVNLMCLLHIPLKSIHARLVI